MMNAYNIIQWKKSSGYVYNGFSSKESAATSSIMELLSYIYVNQTESWETFRLQWINCLPKQKETPLILINDKAEMRRLVIQVGSAGWGQKRVLAQPVCPRHGSRSPERAAWAGSCSLGARL